MMIIRHHKKFPRKELPLVKAQLSASLQVINIYVNKVPLYLEAMCGPLLRLVWRMRWVFGRGSSRGQCVLGGLGDFRVSVFNGKMFYCRTNV